jgi:hypothetical protein
MAEIKAKKVIFKNRDGEHLIPYVGDSILDNKITNCLLEVPQRIKLELNNGVLTLKAGSEVIVPNSFEVDGTTPKFDYQDVYQDVSFRDTVQEPIETWTDKWFLFYNYVYGNFDIELCSHCYSGTTLPTGTNENRKGYNTAINKIQISSSGGAYTDTTYSLPVCQF